VVQAAYQGFRQNRPKARPEYELHFRPERDALAVSAFDGEVSHGRAEENRHVVEAGDPAGQPCSPDAEIDADEDEDRGQANGEEIGRQDRDHAGDR
jgi:hypothetical protein